MSSLDKITDFYTEYGLNRSQVLLIFLIIVTIGNLFYVSGVNVLESKAYASTFTVFFMIMLLAVYKLFTSKSENQSTSKSDQPIAYTTIFVIFAFLLFSVVSEFYSKYIKTSAIFQNVSDSLQNRVIINLVQISLVIAIVVVGISAVNNFFGRWLNNAVGWPGFIINLIVYIPCLLTDFIKYLKAQYGITSSVTFILLAIEATLIAGYAFIPSLIASKLKEDSITVMNSPEFLDNAVIKSFDKQDIGEHDYKRTNYAFSMWVYINPQTNKNNANSNIFSYANAYPKISYIKNDSQTGKDIYRFIVNTQNYDISLTNQKWNNIVMNFNDNDTVDIFINGNLERTFDKSDRKSLINDGLNTITIGSNNGIYGAICNIQYYNRPVRLNEITANYNLLRNNNPPTNNIM
uniref:Uncharacterized protein n=1 Tax=viral metagenome TaxID=1070528 RepID=A0A6C0F157_9ZZZZ